LHVEVRQYRRDFGSVERGARSDPHREWWREFPRNSGGTGFRHEAYFMRGGMEGVYDDQAKDLAFHRVAPVQPARGPMFSARSLAMLAGDSGAPPAVPEDECYS
jgi:hypothetical protein